MFEPIADGEDLHFIEFTRDLLSVAGDERNRRAFSEKLRGGGDLDDLEIEFLREADDVVGIRSSHEKLSRPYERGGAIEQVESVDNRVMKRA